MANLSIKSIFPASGQRGVPLGISPTITLDGLDYNQDSLTEGFFLEGPDTDQFVGPGLLDLAAPDSISQGDLDDFLESPGFQGIVPGTVTVTGVAGETTLTFDPTSTLAPLVQYTINLTGVLDGNGDTVSGFFTTVFTTGSGSIIAVPDETSSTILDGVDTESAVTVDTDLEILKSTPSDRSIQVPITTSEILVDFNKAVVPSSLDGKVTVKATPATDHPNATVLPERDLAFTTTIEGNRLKIKI